MKELLLLSGLGIAALVFEILNIRKLILPFAIVGLLVNIGFCFNDFGTNENIYGMLVLDKIPLAFTILFSFIAILWFIFSFNYIKNDHSQSDHYSLILFSLVGVFILSSYTHLAMLFLGVEILSIPVYVLAGSNKRNLNSNEAAFKYFILGSFASGFLLLGITFVYGAIGSFKLMQIVSTSMSTYGVSQQLLMVGLVLILFALAFKMSAVPFHFWTPDVYTGAPTVITAFMATIVKIGAIVGFFRLFSVVISFYTTYNTILLVISTLTIVIGNIIAATQSNTKRMLAYSSIGHAGFIILGITVLSPSTTYVTWYYLLAYTLSSLAAFWVFYLVSEQAEEEEDISIFKGLVKRNPVLAGTMTIALLSMAGIPPLSGFFAKYFILVNVLASGKTIIAVVAILASLIGVYYYFKIIIAMFSMGAEKTAPIKISGFNTIALLLISALILVAGIIPDLILRFVFR
ncbi:MAG: NADH-quinone oxidoreductase subunit N [Chitinophagales bacterium]